MGCTAEHLVQHSSTCQQHAPLHQGCPSCHPLSPACSLPFLLAHTLFVTLVTMARERLAQTLRSCPKPLIHIHETSKHLWLSCTKPNPLLQHCASSLSAPGWELAVPQPSCPGWPWPCSHPPTSLQSWGNDVHHGVAAVGATKTRD